MTVSEINSDLAEARKKIDILRQELAETNAGVVALNLELEQRIEEKERAEAALRETNAELESFSYSVSHDLKAPLRAITGFSRILTETCGQGLDAEGLRLVNLISDNARELGNLIDHLLAFSRLGRKALLPVRVDTRELVRELIAEMDTQRPPDTLDFVLEDLPVVVADRSLIRQVFANLIGNAVKYSAKTSSPRVWIGSQPQGREMVFHVRDNGAGFDMTYSDRLFGVFQRLHGTREFEGTGIGLAIVKRIVSRHGGRVWAEGRVNGGAAFFFSLPLEWTETEGSGNGGPNLVTDLRKR